MMAEVGPPENKELPCTFCSQTFSKDSALGLHIKKHYYPFECSICARKIKTEVEVLRHEATHVESTRRPTTSPPTRNRDFVALAPEKQPVVKNSFFDVQNPLLPQILDDAPKKATHENSAGMVVATSPQVAISGKSKVAQISKLENHKKPLLAPGPPQKGPTNKKAAKKQSDAKNSPKKLNHSPEKQTAGRLVTNNERGSLPESIVLPAQLKVTSNKSNKIKTDFKAGEEERRRELIFRQAVEYDEVKKRCDELEEEIARLELEFGCNSEFVKSEIKLEPIDVNQDMEDSGEEGTGLGKEKRGEDERKMEVDDEEEKWEVGGVAAQMVPPGWKVSKGPTRKFKSPEGFVFETSASAIQFMMNSSYEEALIKLMVSHLEEEGWRKEANCPPGWKARPSSKDTTGVEMEFLSPSMEFFPGILEMLTYSKQVANDLDNLVDASNTIDNILDDPNSMDAMENDLNILSRDTLAPSLLQKEKKELTNPTISVGHLGLSITSSKPQKQSTSPPPTTPEKRKALASSASSKKPKMEPKVNMVKQPSPKKASTKPGLEMTKANMLHKLPIKATPLPPSPTMPRVDSSLQITKVPLDSSKLAGNQVALDSKMLVTKVQKRRSIEDAIAKAKMMGQTAKRLQSRTKLPPTSVKQETNNDQTKKSLPSKKKPVQKETSKSDQEVVKRKEKPEKLTEEQILELEALFIESPESNLAGFPQAMKYTSLAAAWQVDRMLVIKWFQQRKEEARNEVEASKEKVETEEKKEEERKNRAKAGAKLGRKKNGEIPKMQQTAAPDVQAAGRRMRSQDKLRITKEQRWRLEASRDRGTFLEDLDELIAKTGLSLESVERWQLENPPS